MSNIYRIYLVIVFALAVLQLNAQFTYNEVAQKAHNEILSLNGFDIADYESLDKENGVWLWLESYQSFVEVATTSEVINVDSSINQISNNLSLIEKLSKENPLYYYCSADLHFFLSYLHVEQYELVSSYYHFVKAKNLIKSQQNIFPYFQLADKHKLVLFFVNSFVNQQIGFGNVSNAKLQNEYINLLSSCMETANGVYFRELKLLGVLLSSYLANSDANTIVDELNIDLDYGKAGPMEAFVSSYWCNKAEYFNTQLSILEYADKYGFQNKYNPLSFWYGNALLNQGNDTSIVLINKFLSNQNRMELVSYARFKASLYWFEQGEMTKSDSINSLIINSKKNESYADKQAVYEVKNANNWVRELVLARLLFDGGNYEKTKEILLGERINIQNYNKQQKLEYSYRMGRIYDKLGNKNGAKKFYQMVISSDLDSEFYYPAYASYYLGRMYLDDGDIETANRYFNICVKLDSPIYKNSIHNKAKNMISK